jgi:MFS superfamily sulfate permease-like transporter
MNDVLKALLTNLANLLKVKSIISLLVVFTTCYLTCKGTIEVAIFMSMASAIITYYFTKDNNKNDKESEDK